ncbi:MAG TPA: GNAT family protein [Methylomirabilota bacterium]|nr:GNAT family protein [Methylomirabilota bacterium]
MQTYRGDLSNLGGAMSGYFGTQAQQRVQARVAGLVEWIATTPGAASHGRCLACDDTEALGWDTIGEIVDRDGVMAFPMFPADRMEDLIAFMTARGCRADFWDAFIGPRDAVLAASDAILEAAMPGGIREEDAPRDPEAGLIRQVQALMASNGVSPYPGSMLAGLMEPAVLVILVDGNGEPVAVAFGHRPHNAHSRFHQYGYSGAVAVAPDHRGRGLGRRANAMVTQRVIRDLGCTHIQEYVSPDNLPSRKMTLACGLRPDPAFRGAIAVAGESKFTR